MAGLEIQVNTTDEAVVRDQMNIVMIGHVDHGKSTVIGRLLADTGSLPKGKLESVRAMCKMNARPFEYAFLLDALKDEQAQGITIDSARCFFKSAKREYIIIDAPGHIEFLKNMISGAARAEAAVLVIDAKEGVRENSRRHGYLLSMLGVKQVAICVNKMDLVDYSQEVFERIVKEFTEFLGEVGIRPMGFVPASARKGDCIVTTSEKMGWYNGKAVLAMLDSFVKEASSEDKPLRFPVQDIYKFTAEGDDRRIVAGRIETGKLKVGDEVVFLPSGKKSKVASVEGFNLARQTEAVSGQSTGIMLTEQIYIKPGELICKTNETVAKVGTHLRVNIFWMGHQPMIKNKRYKLKLAGVRVPVWLKEIVNVLDASKLTTDTNRQQIERHDVAECILETLSPVAFDVTQDIAQTGRFVIIDNYEITGGGVVLAAAFASASRIDEHVKRRQQSWDRSNITQTSRSERYNQRATLVLITGPLNTGKKILAKSLEEDLFSGGRSVYYLGLSNTLLGDETNVGEAGERDEFMRRLGEVSHLFTNAGLILITTISDLEDHELEVIDKLNQPNDILVVNVGEKRFASEKIDLQLEEQSNPSDAIEKIKQLLAKKNYLIEYYL